MRCLVGEPTIGPLETWVQQTQLYRITRVLHSTHLSAFGIACTFRICSCPFQVSHPGKSRDPMMLASIIPLCERDLSCADMAHAPVVVNVNFSAPQPVQESRTRVATSQKGEFPLTDRVAPGGRVFSVHRLHEQELQVILRAKITGESDCSNGMLPQGDGRLSAEIVPFLHISIHNGLDEQFLQHIKRDPCFERLAYTVIRCPVFGSGFCCPGEAMLKFTCRPGKQGFN